MLANNGYRVLCRRPVKLEGETCWQHPEVVFSADHNAAIIDLEQRRGRVWFENNNTKTPTE